MYHVSQKHSQVSYKIGILLKIHTVIGYVITTRLLVLMAHSLQPPSDGLIFKLHSTLGTFPGSAITFILSLQSSFIYSQKVKALRPSSKRLATSLKPGLVP